MSLEDLENFYKKVGDIHRKHQKILEVSDGNKGRITLVLKDNYRQSGRVKNMNFSASFDKGMIAASIAIFDDSNNLTTYDIAEIVDVY